MNQVTFNSYLDDEEYKVIKIEAVQQDITVKERISCILSEYVKRKRKEEQDAVGKGAKSGKVKPC